MHETWFETIPKCNSAARLRSRRKAFSVTRLDGVLAPLVVCKKRQPVISSPDYED
jgi:hypothetical protein